MPNPVLTVNLKSPDSNGNIQLTAEDIGGNYVQKVNDVGPDGSGNVDTPNYSIANILRPFGNGSSVTMVPGINMLPMGDQYAGGSDTVQYTIQMPDWDSTPSYSVCRLYLSAGSYAYTHKIQLTFVPNKSGITLVDVGSAGSAQISMIFNRSDLNGTTGYGISLVFVKDDGWNVWYLVGSPDLDP